MAVSYFDKKAGKIKCIVFLSMLGMRRFPLPGKGFSLWPHTTTRGGMVNLSQLGIGDFVYPV